MKIRIKLMNEHRIGKFMRKESDEGREVFLGTSTRGWPPEYRCFLNVFDSSWSYIPEGKKRSRTCLLRVVEDKDGYISCYEAGHSYKNSKLDKEDVNELFLRSFWLGYHLAKLGEVQVEVVNDD